MEEDELDVLKMDLMGKTPASTGDYKHKEVKDWKWMDFYNYFDSQYVKIIGKARWVTIKQRNAKKRVIEQSYEFWGKDVFKAMIDWLFANYKDYPQWKDLDIGLICGSHYWAKMIGENAKLQLEVDKRWER
jgi:hypothetical protein